MQVIIAYCVVAVENHGRVAFGSREIIHGRSCRNFLACLDRKARDKAPQPVYQVHLRSGGEQVLKLAVVVVVYLPDVAADLRLERNAPDILPVLVLKADGEVAVLVDRVGFPVAQFLTLNGPAGMAKVVSLKEASATVPLLTLTLSRVNSKAILPSSATADSVTGT